MPKNCVFVKSYLTNVLLLLYNVHHMTKTTLSQKYQIVIPKEIRNEMHLNTGSEVTMHAVDENMAVIVRHPKDVTKALTGLGKEVWQKLGGVEYIKRERAAWDKPRV